MEITDEKFKERKACAEACYRAIKPVRCPYFEDEVSFSAEGLEHVLFKSRDKGRSREERYARLRLIPYIADIIRRSGTLQEFTERNAFVRQKSNGSWSKIMKLVRYYVFVAIIDGLRMKVVVKEVYGEKKKFHSVYPSWKTEPDGQGGRIRKFYSGDPEND